MKLTDEQIAIILHHPYFETMWTQFEDHIKKLEERIMVLELSSPYRKVRDDEAGEEYWEHG